MTNISKDNKEKIREILDRLEYISYLMGKADTAKFYNLPKEATEEAMRRLPISKTEALSQILALTDKPLLDEKEVEKVFDKFVPVGKGQLGMMLAKEHRDKIVKELCSHFSKPVIKYPEKLPLTPNSAHCSQCRRDFYAFNNGYNQAIQDFIELNKEKNDKKTMY